ncbi:helix-turn-helix domain-containing protein [Zobellella maritima]|uniref:helix-turn-helix domain-containing protein n=1 Tax=Zobellella maritima TaxID=2059725 RepID=UPI000E3005AE|nr:helix-turn-helix domain-containing protein [Zobellella maritima]
MVPVNIDELVHPAASNSAGFPVSSPDRREGTTNSTIHGFGSWRDFADHHFPGLEMVSDCTREFWANVRLRSFGERSLASIQSSSLRVSHTEPGIRPTESGYIKVMWQQAGSMRVEQDGRSARLSTGGVTICDTARPYCLTLEQNAQLAFLILPYEAVPGWGRLSPRVCGTALGGENTTARAALAATLALLDPPCQDDPDGASPVLQAVQLMLSAFLHGSTVASPRCRPAGDKLNAAYQYIMMHIGDPELGPDELAGALHVSRRTLYSLFKDYHLTPGHFIRKVRLEAVRDALEMTCNAHRSILEIALDHGFTDSASFSRSFKSAFGISPRDWRQRAIMSSGY